MAEINQSGSNMKLTPQQKQLIQVLKQINEGKYEFAPAENESLEQFQSTVRCLKQAENKYIGKVNDDMKSIERNSPGMVIQAWVIGGLTFEGYEVLNNPQKLLFDSNPQANINMTTINNNQNINAPVYGSVLAAQTIENCLNTVQNSPADNEIKQLLTDLLKQISELNSKVPAEVINQISRDAEDLVTEINSENPRKRNSLFSLEGIKEAALTVGEIAKPILVVAEKLSPLLLGI